MKPTIEAMRAQALVVMQRAYAPYSKFQVGACILEHSGGLYVGCNVENASYGLTACAEAGAISAMVAAGGCKIEAVVIVSSAATFCPPCGSCRQRLYEFSSETTTIFLFNEAKEMQSNTLMSLLPLPFKKGF